MDELKGIIARALQVLDPESGLIRITARLTLRLWDPATGRTLAWEVLEPGNLVVTAGLAHIADQMLSAPTQASMSHMAIGTGTTAPAAGDTALGTEANRQALGSKTRSASKVTYYRSFAAGQGTGAITEMGILNSASAGTLLCRQTFAAKNKGANDVLDITLEHTYS